MSPFGGVANEIIIRIIEMTSAGDIVSLASCCKHFNALAQERLAFHRRKRAEAEDIVIGFSFREFQRWKEPPIIHPSKYLQDILKDDDCRFYTKVMRIGSLDFSEPADEGENEAILELVGHVETQYGHKITALVDNVYTALLQYLGEFDVKAWTKMINEGNCAAVIFLLFTLYPNLETLEIYDPEEIWSNEEKWGGRLLSLISIVKRPDTNKLRLFSRFSEFVLWGYDDDVCIEVRAQLAVPFMELPSMRKILGRVLHGRDLQWTADVGTSEVINLDLQGDIDRASLWSLIRGCKGLKFFSFRLSTDPGWAWTIDINELDSLKWGPQAENDATCEDTDSLPCPENKTEADRPIWEPRGIVANLWLYASHSLVSLDLTAGSLAGVVKLSNDEPFIESLRFFRALKFVHLDTMMLFKKTEPSSSVSSSLGRPKQKILWEKIRPHRLVDFLPITIKDFGMTSSLVGKGLSREDVVEMFSDLPRCRNRLPRLEVIKVERNDERGQSQEEKNGDLELSERCRINHITLLL